MARTLILILVAILLMSNTSCQTTQSRLNQASRSTAAAQVRTPLPDWPTYCRDLMPAVVPKVGELFRHTQARWEVVRENENRRIEWCAAHFEGIRTAVGDVP